MESLLGLPFVGITGPAGSGKTDILLALGDILTDFRQWGISDHGIIFPFVRWWNDYLHDFRSFGFNPLQLEISADEPYLSPDDLLTEGILDRKEKETRYRRKAGYASRGLIDVFQSQHRERHGNDIFIRQAAQATSPFGAAVGLTFDPDFHGTLVVMNGVVIVITADDESRASRIGEEEFKRRQTSSSERSRAEMIARYSRRYPRQFHFFDNSGNDLLQPRKIAEQIAPIILAHYGR